MADYLIQDTTLDAIADAINAKTGGSSAMTPADMVTAIGNISGGSSEVIEITTVSDMPISGLLTLLQNASGNTSLFAINATPDSGSGSRLFGGAYIIIDPEHIYSTIYRRNSEGSYAGSTWNNSLAVAAGTKFMVWGVDAYV